MNDPRPISTLRADARRNRARVLGAAAEAFAAAGSDVSVDEIARRAGVGAGTVYRHFPTKEALFEAVVADRITALTAEADTLADDGQFLEFVERLATEGAYKRDLIECLGGVGLDRTVGPDVTTLTAALVSPLQRAQTTGVVRADITAGDLMAVVSGGAFAISRSDGHHDRVRTILAVLVDGLRPRPNG